LVDNFRIWNNFLGFRQIESHGTSRWAFLSELRVKNLLWQWHPTELFTEKSILGERTSDSKDLSGFQKILYKFAKPFFLLGLPENPLENGYLPVASFGFGRWICLPLQLVARHMCFLGPPGSGKSASFFIMQARAFSRLGSAVILDLKGEIYRHSAFYYKKAFRMDFQRPETSDRFLLGSLCYNDPLAAGEIADLIVGYDPNTQTGGNPFWEESASMLLRCLLLFLAQKDTNFTPADIFEFIANHQFDEASKTDRLAEAMMDSGNEDIRNAFAPFAQLDSRTKSNILISMAAKLKPFQDPHVQKVLSAPTKEEAARGCRIIDPALLRTKGTALFVVVPEGRASQLSNVLGTFFGSVANVLRRTGDTEDFKAFVDLHARRVARSNRLNWTPDDATRRYIEENDLTETIENPAFVMLQFDEAGNVPLRNLSEDIGVGRGRKMCYVLGYQNFDQPEKQYGASVAGSILQSIGTKWALTGLTSKTSKYIVELMGKTTTYEYSSSDAEDDRFDRSSRRETMRDLMSDDELRTMPAYTQAVMISTDIRPLRVGFPPLAKEVDSFEESAPVYFDPNELTLEISEAFDRDWTQELKLIKDKEAARRPADTAAAAAVAASAAEPEADFQKPIYDELNTALAEKRRRQAKATRQVNTAGQTMNQAANQAGIEADTVLAETVNQVETEAEIEAANGSSQTMNQAVIQAANKAEFEAENNVENKAENVVGNGLPDVEKQVVLPFEYAMNGARPTAEAAAMRGAHLSKSGIFAPDKSAVIEARRAASARARELVKRDGQTTDERGKSAAERNREAAEATFKSLKRKTAAEIDPAPDNRQSASVMPKSEQTAGDKNNPIDNYLV
jgi:type IV secretory pathway TraG/TraD family ATPase VirD4